jgi:hypothetical protein
MPPRPISVGDPTSALGDYRRYPGARVFLTCALCGWSKSYRAERLIDRLRELKAGGHATTLAQVARRVGWNCPGCHRVKWRCGFAWPPGMDAHEVRRLARQYRD